MKKEKKTELESEYITYMVRYYDDWHEDKEVLWRFKIVHTIFDDCYTWSFISVRDDWTIWLLNKHEVSWWRNPTNWWIKYSFDELWKKEEIMKRFE